MATLFPERPKVVFIFAKTGSSRSTRFGGFVTRLKKYGALQNVDAHYCALEDLVFMIIDKTHARVMDMRSGLDLSSVSFAYFKGWESMPEEAAALAQFFQALGIPYVDTLVSQQGVSKLVSHFKLWRAEVSVAPTLYARRPEYTLRALQEFNLGWGPTIVKTINGQKGRDNYLAHSQGDVESILEQNPTKQFMLQRYIPNDGDMRIGVYGEKVRFALRRVGASGNHLHNTSQGGKAELIALSAIDKKVRKYVIQAAGACELQVAGVDVLQDTQTGQAYVLEVNQGSQIVTGAFIEQKIAAFDKFLNQEIHNRYNAKSAEGKRLRLIGRRTYVDFPEFGLKNIVAKIDTGAYSSALNAANIRVEREDGKEVLRFDLPTDSGTIPCLAHEFKETSIRNSSGHRQHRYLITTTLVAGGKRMQIRITLADRRDLNFPVLLGRRVIRSKFLVNVELSERNLSEWKY